MKKIDKKACRQFLEPLVPPASDCGLFLVQGLKYIVRTAVKIVGHRRLLILCLYARGDSPDGKPTLAYTIFQASNSFITYDHDPDSKTRWRTAILNNLSGVYHYARHNCAFYSSGDEQRVLRFCEPYVFKRCLETGFDALFQLQQQLRGQETLCRQKRRERTIRAKFSDLRPLPSGLEGWMQREVMPAYFFYDYKKGRRSVQGICTACGREVELSGVRHNAKGVCPSCGRPFIMKSNGKRGHIWDRATVSVVQRMDSNHLIVRIVKASLTRPKDRPCEWSCYEAIRVIVGADGNGKAFEEAYHHSWESAGITRWKKGYPPVFYLYQQNFYAEPRGWLYCENLRRELKGTAWQYCQIGAFYEGIQSTMEVAPYLSAYRNIPSIEFFVKLGLLWLVSAVVYGRHPEKIIDLEGRNLREVLQIEPADLPCLQQPGAGIFDLMLLRLQRTAGHQPNADFSDFLHRNDVTEVGRLERVLRYATPHKVMRYFQQQFAKMKPDSYRGHNGIVSDYDDYLGFCERLQYDMKNEFVLFPKNLKGAHDQAQTLIKQENAKQYDLQIASAQEQLKRRYQFKSGGLVVLPPKSAREIVAEGQKLRHCVGSYAASMAKKQCTILFIRREKRKQKPFYTVEVKDDRIIQVRGINNCDPTPEVTAFLNAWEKKKHLTNAA